MVSLINSDWTEGGSKRLKVHWFQFQGSSAADSKDIPQTVQQKVL